MGDIDDNGYWRDDDGKLAHRKIAYQKIYRKNRNKYPLRFSEYHVHHIDGNKMNNHPDNLAILTPGEHAKEHGLRPQKRHKTPEYTPTFSNSNSHEEIEDDYDISDADPDWYWERNSYFKIRSFWDTDLGYILKWFLGILFFLFFLLSSIYF